MADRQTVIAALYKFVYVADARVLRVQLLRLCRQAALRGTVLVASEGINGTVAGSRAGINMLRAFLAADTRLADAEYKETHAATPPFHRMKVRLKNEIVTMGVPHIDPARLTGQRVGYAQWNRLLSDPSVLVIDVRNTYEHILGTFKGAISPHTTAFREFPSFARSMLDAGRHKRVALFCTGGIRCEKASNYLLQNNFSTVYQLDGGILRYLETATAASAQNMWQGECFVFDNRVSVNKRLQPGSYRQCFACRHALSPQDMQSTHYVAGISCPYCINAMTQKKYRRVSERQQQMALAKRHARVHIGDAATHTALV